MVSLLTQICVTRPQWVNTYFGVYGTRMLKIAQSRFLKIHHTNLATSRNPRFGRDIVHVQSFQNLTGISVPKVLTHFTKGPKVPRSASTIEPIELVRAGSIILAWVTRAFIQVWNNTLTSIKHHCVPKHKKLNRLFNRFFFRLPKLKITKLGVNILTFHGRNPPVPCPFPHKGPVIQEAFSCHYFVMARPCDIHYILWNIWAAHCFFDIVSDLMTWWRYQMETLSALLAICTGNSPVPGEFPAGRPVTLAGLWCFLWSASE